MPSKTNSDISWKMRMGSSLFKKIEKLAKQESRTTANMVRLLLEEALVARGK